MVDNSFPKVFVLVLSFNGKRWLEDCLPSVVAMDYPNFETVVIDNGSSDGTQEFLTKNFSRIHNVYLKDNVGYARGFNAGLEYAALKGAEYFMVMNNDTVIDSHALTALVETAQDHPEAGFVVGKVYLYDRPDVFQSVGKKFDPIQWSGDHIGYNEKDQGQYEDIAERAFTDDVYMLVTRKVYDNIGGYDPQFYLQAEEFDWQARAKKNGFKCFYTPHARLWHRGSMTIGGSGSPVAAYFFVRSRILVMYRNANFWQFLRFYVWVVFKSTFTLLKGLVQLKSEKIKPRLAVCLGFVSGTLWLFHRRPAMGVPPLIALLQK